MRQVIAHLTGLSPYSQSRMHQTPKLPKEAPDDYDTRTWRDHCTTDANGQIVIPAMALKFALMSAAQKIGRKIPGRGNATYSKYFKADVFCAADVPLGIHKDAVTSIKILAHAKGERTDGKRVPRIFPMIYDWKGEAHFIIGDDTVTPEIFEEALIAAGHGIGIGRFRPENAGLNGRFEVTRLDWI